MLKLVYQVIYLEYAYLYLGRIGPGPPDKCSCGKGRQWEIMRRGCQNIACNLGSDPVPISVLAINRYGSLFHTGQLSKDLWV